MGSNDFYAEERPTHTAAVSPFAIDEHPVTNAEFRRFAKATGHVTTAELPPSAADFPGADAADLVPGSLVFMPTSDPVPLDDWQRWWRWVPGACWRAPTGPGSTLGGLELHPVVHVSVRGRPRLRRVGRERTAHRGGSPEYAARAGNTPTDYAWGAEFMPRGKPMANTWHGRFPW